MHLSWSNCFADKNWREDGVTYEVRFCLLQGLVKTSSPLYTRLPIVHLVYHSKLGHHQPPWSSILTIHSLLSELTPACPRTR